jgi:gp6-like head-tail connector protein
MSLVTLAEAKSWSNIYFSEKDAEVQLLIDAAEKHLADFLGEPDLSSFVEYADSPQDSPASAVLDARAKVSVLNLFDELWQNRGIMVVGTITQENPIWQRIAHFMRGGLGV